MGEGICQMLCQGATDDTHPNGLIRNAMMQFKEEVGAHAGGAMKGACSILI